MAREQRTRSRPGTAARTAGAAGTAVTGRAPVLLGQGLDSLGRRHHSAPWCSAARSQPGPSPGNEGPWAGRGPTPSRSSSPVCALVVLAGAAMEAITAVLAGHILMAQPTPR